MNDIKIDKTGWKKYRFDEFAQNISERVEPSQTDLELYVGLEHLDPDCLHIKRHGTPSDVEGTKLHFYPGDVIFGKRRAYQRKTGLATFEGICSAHAMVLRAKEDVVDPHLFPFLFHSKIFIDTAITISVGGLSPTINWKDIAKQEFFLPPKAEQQRLAELLWAADDVVEKEKVELERVREVLRSSMIDIGNRKNDLLPICEVCYILDNLRKPINSSERRGMQGDIPYYGANGIVDYINKYMFDEDLVLLAEDCGSYQNYETQAISYKISGKSWINNHVHVLKAKESIINTNWLYYCLAHKDVIKYINGSTRGKLTKDALEKITIYVPPIFIQEQFCDIITKYEDSANLIAMQVSLSQQMKQELINKIF